MQKPIVHTVNVHERCKNNIEYLALAQWFLKLLPYKEKFLELGNTIRWYPDFMKFRYINWVENISWDWCLSRQRFYGIPFPVWYCTACDTPILADEKDLPVDPQEQAAPKACSSCKSSDTIPDTDVMDTWNTSSLTPLICQELYKGDQSQSFLPMSMRPQAHDIIRTWAFYTIVKAWMHDTAIPWESIIMSGHVLTTEGQKISKSQSNSPLVPENLLKMYPADVIRYWTASATLGNDVAFSETQLKIGQRLMVKLWNAFRFIGEHIKSASQNSVSSDQELKGIANQWILHRMSQTVKTYTHYFDSYEFSLALETIERFFWHDFCDNYLELVKDQLFNPEKYSADEVAATRWVLALLGMRILQLIAPFMPHITETIYQLLFKDIYTSASLHQVRLSALQEPLTELAALAPIEPILDIIAQVRKLKSDQHLSLKTDIKVLHILSSDPERLKIIQEMLVPHEQLITGVTRAHMFIYKVKQEPAETSSLIVGEEGWQGSIVIG